MNARALSDSDLSSVDTLLKRANRSLAWGEGFFAALHVGPEFLAPSAWMPTLLNEEQFATRAKKLFANAKEANREIERIIALYTEIADYLREEPELVVPEDSAEIAAFCQGFVAGAMLQPDWISAVDGLAQLEPFLAVTRDAPGDVEKQVPALVAQLTAIDAHWASVRKNPLREAQVPVRSDKVGRNEPCRCGSGKKAKKCCHA